MSIFALPMTRHRLKVTSLARTLVATQVNKQRMDKLTPQQRHKTMASIRSKDTKPEMVVRRWLWGHGYRYRLNHPRLPGHPDLVLRKYRTCIFVNGCFWHGHEGCQSYTIPKTNTEFWLNKITRNRERDARVQRELAAMGWHSITVWECELKPKNREKTMESLAFTLNKIFLQDHNAKRYIIPEQQPMMAAEPPPRNEVKNNPQAHWAKEEEV
jgi:DNA mismatch endonuclease (patch repair protein)